MVYDERVAGILEEELYSIEHVMQQRLAKLYSKRLKHKAVLNSLNRLLLFNKHGLRDIVPAMVFVKFSEDEDAIEMMVDSVATLIQHSQIYSEEYMRENYSPNILKAKQSIELLALAKLKQLIDNGPKNVEDMELVLASMSYTAELLHSMEHRKGGDTDDD